MVGSSSHPTKSNGGRGMGIGQVDQKSYDLRDSSATLNCQGNGGGHQKQIRHTYQ